MTPSTQALTEQALTLRQQADALAITDQDALDAAAAFVAEVIIPLRKEAEAVFDPICKAAHEAHRKATEGRAKVLEPIATAERTVRGSINRYLTEQERLRIAEQQRLDAIARAERENAERQARDERENALREAEELVEAEIQTMEAAGIVVDDVKVAELMERGMGDIPLLSRFREPITAPIVARSYVAPKGISTRETWKAEVIDLHQLAAHVARTGQTGLISADMTALNRMAGALQKQFNIPGVRAVTVNGIAIRGKR